MLRYHLAAATLVAIVALAAGPLPAPASPNGLAWDSVTKISRNTDAASLQPGSFDQDYATAAAVPPPPESTGGGVFGKMNQAMAMGQHLQALLQNGFAERLYVAGSKERTDQVSDQTATIVDCTARTITTLDVRKKTYRVVSMDTGSAPSSSGGTASAPQPRATDDGTRDAITIANKALGSRELAGQPTNGFSSDMSFTETKASGESQSYNGDLVGYYSRYPNPTPDCSPIGGASRNTQGGPNGAQALSAMTGGYARFMRALSQAGLSSRVSLKQSGPPLPRGKLAMYEAATIGGGQRGGATFVTERGNVRSISPNDPIFSVPGDFTREQ
jgi:hypothetical protein